MVEEGVVRAAVRTRICRAWAEEVSGMRPVMLKDRQELRTGIKKHSNLLTAVMTKISSVSLKGHKTIGVEKNTNFFP